MPKPEIENKKVPHIVAEVDRLSEEVKSLALSLALVLAKLKSRTDSKEYAKLEPEFIRLVNGTIRVVQEVTTILNAAKNQEIMVFEMPMDRFSKDKIEVKLHGILEQCTRVLESITDNKDLLA